MIIIEPDDSVSAVVDEYTDEKKREASAYLEAVYRRRSRRALGNIVKWVSAAVLLAVLPCVLVKVGLTTAFDYDPHSSPGAAFFAGMLFAVPGAVVVAAIVMGLSSLIRSEIREVRQAKESWITSGASYALAAIKKRRRWTVGLLVFVAAWVIVIMIGSAVAADRNRTRIFAEADRLYAEGHYAEAADKYYELCNPDYGEARTMYYLCISHEAYESGDLKKAVTYANLAGDKGFLHGHEEKTEELEVYRAKVKEEYDEYQEEYYKRLREANERKALIESAQKSSKQKSGSSKSSSKSSTKKKSSSSDPYNASDYAHAEDFYEWYYDDFYDYEEAEEYWEEHGG